MDATIQYYHCVVGTIESRQSIGKIRHPSPIVPSFSTVGFPSGIFSPDRDDFWQKFLKVQKL
jgi:hypothetical protein